MTLAGGRATPLIGAAFVLPVSATLPGGYLGKVASISPDGRSVHLVAAGLADAFDYYRIDADLSTLSPKVIRALAHNASARTARPSAIAHSAAGLCRLGGSLRTGVVLHSVTFQPGGHFSSSLVKNGWGIPTGAQFDLQAQLKTGLAADISLTGKLSCSLKIPKLTWMFTLDPVPMSLVFVPNAEVNVTDQMTVKNVGFTVTFGFWTKGQLGAHNSADGGLIGSAALTTPTNTWGSSLGLNLGGELTIGPGGAANDGVDAGAIAGVGGKLNPVVGSLGPEFTDYGDQRHTKCIKASLWGEGELNINAKAWLGTWSLGTSLTVPALQRKMNYLGSPWYWPNGCERLPAGGGGGTGGGGSDGAGHVYWGHYDGTSEIARANLDGSSMQPNFIAGLDQEGIDGLALDGAHIYWRQMSYTSDGQLLWSISRANLDGSDVQRNFIAGQGVGGEGGLAVAGSHIYWGDWNNPGWSITRANVDGGDVRTNFIADPDMNLYHGLAADGSHIYWPEVVASGGREVWEIGRANLDGSDVQFIALADAGGGLVTQLAADGAHIYFRWSDNATGASSIGRANVDGSDVEPHFITDAGAGVGLAADGAHVYWNRWDPVTGMWSAARANTDGSDVQPHFITTGAFTGPLAVGP